MTTTDHHRTDQATAEPAPAVDLERELLDGMGGPWGMVCTTAPVLVFVAANSFVALPTTIGIAIAAALAALAVLVGTWAFRHSTRRLLGAASVSTAALRQFAEVGRA